MKRTAITVHMSIIYFYLKAVRHANNSPGTADINIKTA